MKFTLSWLKDHLDTEATLERSSTALIGVGLEVEDSRGQAEALAPFTVARCERGAASIPMPTGCASAMSRPTPGVIQVVCGAPNARTGMNGIFAPPGTHIPGTGIDAREGRDPRRRIERHAVSPSASC